MGLLGEARRGLEAGCFLALAQLSPGRGAPPGCQGDLTLRWSQEPMRARMNCACRGLGSAGRKNAHPYGRVQIFRTLEREELIWITY